MKKLNIKWQPGFSFHGQNVSNSPVNKILIDGLEVVENCSFDYAIGAGTLLGLYRDGKLISWDTDVDIEVYFEKFGEIEKKQISDVMRLMELNGFKLIKETYYEAKPQQIAWCRENQFVFDISIFHREGERYVCSHDLGDLVTLKKHKGDGGLVLGMKTHEDKEGYLEYRYGKGWKIPTSSPGKTYEWLAGDGVIK